WDAVCRSDRIAVIDDVGEHSFSSIDVRAQRIAASLKITTGERVAIDCPPGAGFVAAFFGILRAGGCAIVLSPSHPKAERDYFLSDAHVRIVLAGHEPSAGAMPWKHGIDMLQLYTSGTTGKPKGAVHTDASLGAQMEILHVAWKLSKDDTLQATWRISI